MNEGALKQFTDTYQSSSGHSPAVICSAICGVGLLFIFIGLASSFMGLLKMAREEDGMGIYELTKGCIKIFCVCSVCMMILIGGGI